MIGAGAALAQAPATAPAKMTPDEKQAISKSCSDQANAKGWHAKQRNMFRSESNHNAGKPQ
jgi:hypothetical protein